jgi:hypothetical protein
MIAAPISVEAVQELVNNASRKPSVNDTTPADREKNIAMLPIGGTPPDGYSEFSAIPNLCLIPPFALQFTSLR